MVTQELFLLFIHRDLIELLHGYVYKNRINNRCNGFWWSWWHIQILALWLLWERHLIFLKFILMIKHIKILMSDTYHFPLIFGKLWLRLRFFFLHLAFGLGPLVLPSVLHLLG